MPNMEAVTLRGDDPIRHGISPSYPPYIDGSKRPGSWRALCGAQVTVLNTGTPFNPMHPRACPKCRKENSIRDWST